MIKSLFILNTVGDIVLEKHWQGRTGRNIISQFWNELTKENRTKDLPPIIRIRRQTLIHLRKHNLLYLVVVDQDTSPLMFIEFLNRVIEVFTNFFSAQPTEHSLKENLPKAFELLGEMMDNVFPVTTESSMLKDMIGATMKSTPNTIENSKKFVTLSSDQVGGLPWRRKNINHSHNEIFFDIVESINATIERSGKCLNSEIISKINCESKLSGMPSLTMVFNNSSILEDVSFHQCINIDTWERRKILDFVPPDGAFELLSYRSNRMQTQIPLYTSGRFSWSKKKRRGKFEVILQLRNSLVKSIDNVSVLFPLSRGCSSPAVKTTNGAVFFNDQTFELKWEIKKMPKNKEVTMKGSIKLPNKGPIPSEKPVALITFSIEGLCMSGLKVTNLNISNLKKKIFKGVKFISKSGNFALKF
ncbi:ap-3 complex subunit mu-1 [Anaeramoeba flamelloides]|uniref:Ap-3 complex subunit mu-1 n=1 Tax=Anaeramoeba flamelloides TaxID=1746091 RepID=A0ABQ8X768_9EUKA|nr:ap-3 complex subunit mu-1 [Anaeramoeba flamelloides]